MNQSIRSATKSLTCPAAPSAHPLRVHGRGWRLRKQGQAPPRCAWRMYPGRDSRNSAHRPNGWAQGNCGIAGQAIRCMTVAPEWRLREGRDAATQRFFRGASPLVRTIAWIAGVVRTERAKAIVPACTTPRSTRRVFWRDMLRPSVATRRGPPMGATPLFPSDAPYPHSKSNGERS